MQASRKAADNETDANTTATAAPVFKDVTKTRKKTIRTPLKIGGPGFVLPPLPADKVKVQLLKYLAPASLWNVVSSQQAHKLAQEDPLMVLQRHCFDLFM